MASAIYPKAKDLLGEGDLDMLVDTIKVILVDTGTYTYDGAHDFMNDVTGTGGTAQTISTPTWVNGLFDGDNETFTAVAGTVSYEALIIYKDTGGASSTNPLIAFIDGLSVTSNGGDITVTWHASGIFQL
jgi:hypothetical protein